MKLKDINKKWIDKTENLSLLKNAIDILNKNEGKNELKNLINNKIIKIKENDDSNFESILNELNINTRTNDSDQKAEEIKSERIILDKEGFKIHAEELRKLGNEAMSLKQYEKAIIYYSESINNYESDPITFSNRALSYLKIKEYKKALLDCDQAIKKFDYYHKALLRRSVAYRGIQEFEKCLKDLFYLINIFNDSSAIHNEIINEINFLKADWKSYLKDESEWKKINNRIDKCLKDYLENSDLKNTIVDPNINNIDLNNIKSTTKDLNEYLGLLKGFNFENFSESRNNMLKHLISIRNNGNFTNQEKIEFIKKVVKKAVETFHDAIIMDCYPPDDIEKIFGMVGDTMIENFENFPVDRAVISAWNGILEHKILSKSQIEEALLKGILPKIFEVSLNKYKNFKNEMIDKYCLIVLKNISNIKWDRDIHKIINEIYTIPNVDLKQFRQEIKQGKFLIAYGLDVIHGYFLSVFDENIQWDKKNSKELAKIFESIDMIGDGGGCYLSLHTGDDGFGKKISVNDMKIIWAKYGVENKYLDIINIQ